MVMVYVYLIGSVFQGTLTTRSTSKNFQEWSF